jgi:microcystin-dependent protein
MANPTVISPQRRRFLARLGAIAAGVALPWRSRSAQAATEAIGPYIGEIMLISWNFPPKGWTFCNGQLLPINQNQALFSLLGTTYGGNGQTTFALPNLQGCVAIHQGQGPGLSPRARGERAGEVSHTLLLTGLAAHTHVARASSADGTAANPKPNVVPARNAGQIPQWAPNADTTLGTNAIGPAGGSQPHENQQPYLVLNYVIALQGTFPTQ